MPLAAFDPTRVFAALRDQRVEFVAIGGWAAGAQGAGWPTLDVDVVVQVTEPNLVALSNALATLGAEYDTPHQPPIRPDLERLRQLTGPQLLRTKYGRLDVLKEAGGETYDSLVVDAVVVEQDGQGVLCASLSALLRMKRAANRPKDAAGVRLLEEALRRREPNERETD